VYRQFKIITSVEEIRFTFERLWRRLAMSCLLDSHAVKFTVDNFIVNEKRNDTRAINTTSFFLNICL